MSPIPYSFRHVPCLTLLALLTFALVLLSHRGPPDPRSVQPHSDAGVQKKAAAFQRRELVGDPRKIGTENPVSTAATLTEANSKLPLYFEPNEGQSESPARFLAHGAGYHLFLTSHEAVVALNRGQLSEADEPHRRPLDHDRGVAPPMVADRKQQSTGDVLRMTFIDADATAQMAGIDELPGKSNYFIGSNPKRWRTDVAHYSAVRYVDIYDGVDLVFYGNQNQLEYDFIVAPHKDPGRIRIGYKGSKSMEIDEAGDLVLHLSQGQLKHRRPRVYQVDNQTRVEVPAQYKISENGEVSFNISRYDSSKALVIDPTFVFSTYLGGAADDVGNAITIDSAGNSYVTGKTLSTNFPTANGFRSTNAGLNDIFVTKLNPTGSSVLYSTYIGGAGNDIAYSIAVNPNGEVYLTGSTGSTNFPLVAALQPFYGGGLADAFLVKLSQSGGALINSSYAGGSGQDIGSGITLDSAGNIYAIGYTASTNLTTTNAIQPFNAGGYDAFLLKASASGTSILYSTYAGGSGDDFGFAIAVDSSGSVCAAGSTTSTNLPTVNALQPANGGGSDAFLARLSPAGTSIVFSTYTGGSGSDYATGIRMDGAGNIYVVGYTDSTDFPLIVNAAQPIKGFSDDAFVAKLNSIGSSVIYGTFLGGDDIDAGYAIAIDSIGNAYVTGETSSTNFPVRNALQNNPGGVRDLFVSKLSPSGAALPFSTYLGGSVNDNGYGIAADDSGNAYIAGKTTSTNFPTVNPFQPSSQGAYDVLIGKIMTVSEGPGFKIAFGSSRNGGNHDVYVTDVDGSTQIRLTNNAAYDDQPKWSPDGSKIAFMSNRDGNFEIYSMNADGSNQVRLTSNLAADGFPVWSPDGAKIAFVSGDLRNPSTFEIYTMNSDGANRTRLTNDALIDGVPAWSPNGSRIVFMSGADSVFDPNSFEIFSMNADGSNRIKLTNNTVVDGQPSYSQDGTRILFASGDAMSPTGIEIYVMNADGSNRTQLTNNAVTDGFPAWSADGTKIVFASGSISDETTVELYIMNADGSNRTQLTANSALDWFPDYQPKIPGVTATMQFSATNYNVAEGNTSAIVTVNRTGDTSGISTVDFASGNGTANQLRDYEVTSGTLTFAAGQTSRTFRVLIVDDVFPESSESINLALSNPTGGILVTPTTATVTIVDNDSGGSTSPVARQFVSNLTGADEVPATPNAVKDNGGIVQLSIDELSAKVSLRFSGLTGSETGAHVHAGAIGVNGPIIFPLPLGNPINNFVVNPTAQQVADLRAGQQYMNVHSSSFVNGEIRGQLLWNPAEEADFFVRQAYFDFLSRVPDTSGFNFWVAEITNCQSDVECLRRKRVDVSNAFFYEQEFQQTAAYVLRLYRGAYGNNQPFPNPNPNPNFPNEEKKLPSYAVFVADRARVIGGSNLAQKQLDLANLFVTRPEFLAKYPASLATADQFVDALLLTLQTDLGVNLSGQRTNLINLYNTQGGRGVVMYRLADDNFTNPIATQPFIDEEYNRSFVLGQYFGYLRRNPDIAGFIFWLGQVNGAPLRNVPRQHAMVCSFITSLEFQLRFGTGISRNNNECPQ